MNKILLVVVAAVMSITEAVRVPNAAYMMGVQAAKKARRFLSNSSGETSTPAPIATAGGRSLFTMPKMSDEEFLQFVIREMFDK